MFQRGGKNEATVRDDHKFSQHERIAGMSDDRFRIALSPTHAESTVLGTWLRRRADFQSPHRSFTMVEAFEGGFMCSI
jgi:hypothetical protein